ncbi:MAG: glutamine synthetase, partial [Aestuariivirgaceae bacterium]
PTTMESGNRSDFVDDDLPRTLWQAIDCLEKGTLLKDYFSARYVEAYAGLKRAEFDAFMSGILQREFDWYL